MPDPRSAFSPLAMTKIDRLPPPQPGESSNRDFDTRFANDIADKKDSHDNCLGTMDG